MIEQDAIEALVTLLESEVQQTTYMASVALANLACCSGGNEIHILEAGTVTSLQAIRNLHRATTDQLARLLLNLSCADDSLHVGGEEVIESVFSLANSETEHSRPMLKSFVSHVTNSVESFSPGFEGCCSLNIRNDAI